MKLIAFKDLLFYHCYDCGWGEKGVIDTCLSFEQAYDVIKELSCQEEADEFAVDEDNHFEFAMNRYMVSKRAYVEADWKGSQDY